MEMFTDGAVNYFSILGPVLTGLALLWKKLDKIWKAINEIKNKKVSHKVCRKRRARCAACRDDRRKGKR